MGNIFVASTLHLFFSLSSTSQTAAWYCFTRCTHHAPVVWRDLDTIPSWAAIHPMHLGYKIQAETAIYTLKNKLGLLLLVTQMVSCQSLPVSLLSSRIGLTTGLRHYHSPYSRSRLYSLHTWIYSRYRCYSCAWYCSWDQLPTITNIFVYNICVEKNRTRSCSPC